MANLRNLRRHIQYTCGDLATECMLAAAYNDAFTAEELQKLVTDIALLQGRTENRLNIKFDKAERDFANRAEYRKARHAYFHTAYKALLADFAKGVQAIVDQMNQDLKKKA